MLRDGRRRNLKPGGRRDPPGTKRKNSWLPRYGRIAASQPVQSHAILVCRIRFVCCTGIKAISKSNGNFNLLLKQAQGNNRRLVQIQLWKYRRTRCHLKEFCKCFWAFEEPNMSLKHNNRAVRLPQWLGQLFLCMGCYGIKSPIGGRSDEALVKSFSVAHVSRPERGHRVSAPSVSSTERMKLTLPVIKLPWLNLQRVNSQHMGFDCKKNRHAQDVEDPIELLNF